MAVAPGPAPCAICTATDVGAWRVVSGMPLQRCRACGFAWFPRSAYDGQSIEAQYVEDVTSPTAYYRCLEPYDRETFTARMRRIIRETGLTPGRVLDVGCNVGTFLSAAAAAGWTPVGVEPNPAAAGLAAARGFEVRREFFDDAVAARLAAFDAVHVGDAIEHVFDPVALLRRAWRTLRPGGLLMVVTPDIDSVMGRLFQIKPREHLVYFTRTALVRAAEAAGFVGARVERSGRRRSIRGLRYSTTFSPRERALVGLLAGPLVHQVVEQALYRLFKDELLLIALRPRPS